MKRLSSLPAHFEKPAMLKLRRPDGPVSRSEEYRELQVIHRIRAYFYGSIHHPNISSFKTRVSISELQVYRYGKGIYYACYSLLHGL